MVMSSERAAECLSPCSPHVDLRKWLAEGREKRRFVLRASDGVAHLVEAWRSSASAVTVRKMVGSEFVLSCVPEGGDLRIVAASGACLEVTGYEAATLVGKLAHELLAAQPSRGEIPSPLPICMHSRSSLVCMRHASGAVIPLVKQLHLLEHGCEAVFLDAGELHASFRMQVDSQRIEWANSAFGLLVGRDVVGSPVSSVVLVDSLMGWDFHEQRRVQILPSQIPPFAAMLRRGHDSNCFTVVRIVQHEALLKSKQDTLPVLRSGFLFEVEVCSGGWSRLYRGQKDGVVCAIKAIDKRALRDANCLQLLDSEVRIQRSCKNEFIVSIFEVHETLDETYVAMELMSISLNFMCLMEDGVCERAAIPLLLNILCALEYLHSRFICHMDVSLENALLSRGEPLIAKLCDFGVAVQKTAETFDVVDLTEAVGKPVYAAPELFGDSPHFRGWGSDVWSYGVSVALFLTGQLWFDCRNEVEQNTLAETLARDDKLSPTARDVIVAALQWSEFDRPSCSLLKRMAFFAPLAID